MLGRPTCSGEKPLPCLTTGCRSKMTKNPFLPLHLHPHPRQCTTLYPQLLPSLTTINSLPLLDHNIVVVHPMSRIVRPMICIEEPCLTCQLLTLLVPLPLVHICPLTSSEEIGMALKPCGMQCWRPSYGP